MEDVIRTIDALYEETKKFSELNDYFIAFSDYSLKIKNWRLKGMTGMILFLDCKKSEIVKVNKANTNLKLNNIAWISYYKALHHNEINALNYADKIEYIVQIIIKYPFISVLPVNNLEFEVVCELYKEELIKYGGTSVSLDSLIEDFWARFGNSTNPEGYLKTKISEVSSMVGFHPTTEAFYNKGFSLEKSYDQKIFSFGYTESINGNIEVSYKKLFKELVSEFGSNYSFSDVMKTILYYMRGVCYSEFYKFLLDQYDSKLNSALDEREDVDDIITSKQQILLSLYLRKIGILNTDDIDSEESDKNSITLLSYLFNRNRDNTRKNFGNSFQAIKAKYGIGKSLRKDLTIVLGIAKEINHQPLVKLIETDLERVKGLL